METQQPSVKDNLHHRVRTKYKLVDTENSMTTNNEETEDIDFASTSDTCLLLPGKLAQTPASVAVRHNENENVWVTSIQLFIPFLLAGFGMVAASLLLDVVQHWPVYQKIPEVYILVPALLGLKGNLEMTLASRLSTQANLGYMDNRKQQWSMVVGNLALIQCQAIVVGFLASLAAVIMGWVPDGEFAIEHALLLCASSVVTSSAASFVLGLIMILVILLSRHFHINPDNVATPIAASLGDLTTLALLSWFASVLYVEIGTHIIYIGRMSLHSFIIAQVPVLAGKASWMSSFISVAGLMVIPLWAWMASKNPHTQKVLTNGWTPVIFAMLISSVGGLILDFTVSKYKGVAVFQLVINGVGGNLVAVQASRISTDMHSKAIPGQLPSHMSLCVNPIKTFCDNGEHAKIAQVLLLMVVPGHLIFSYTISYLQAGHTSLTPVFMAVYLFVALLQVVLLLYIAHVMILWMWKVGVDPDNSAIPYLTAVGDLLGTLLLGIAFQFLYVIGDRDSDVGD